MVTALQWGQAFAMGLLVHLFVAYRFWDSPYMGNSWWVFIPYGAFVIVLGLVLQWDSQEASLAKNRAALTIPQMAVIALIVSSNAFQGIISVADVFSSEN